MGRLLAENERKTMCLPKSSEAHIEEQMIGARQKMNKENLKESANANDPIHPGTSIYSSIIYHLILKERIFII